MINLKKVDLDPDHIIHNQYPIENDGTIKTFIVYNKNSTKLSLLDSIIQGAQITIPIAT